jgi:hypothetical protein
MSRKGSKSGTPEDPAAIQATAARYDGALHTLRNLPAAPTSPRVRSQTDVGFRGDAKSKQLQEGIGETSTALAKHEPGDDQSRTISAFASTGEVGLAIAKSQRQVLVWGGSVAGFFIMLVLAAFVYWGSQLTETRQELLQAIRDSRSDLLRDLESTTRFSTDHEQRLRALEGRRPSTSR